MNLYLKSCLQYPVKSLAEYLLDRFLGKFLDKKIDLGKNGTSFSKDQVVLPDLELNCQVSLRDYSIHKILSVNQNFYSVTRLSIKIFRTQP